MSETGKSDHRDAAVTPESNTAISEPQPEVKIPDISEIDKTIELLCVIRNGWDDQ